MFKNLDDMAREADFFAGARGGISSCVAEGLRQNKESKGFSKVEPSRAIISYHIIIGFLINVQVKGQHPYQWAPFQIAGLLHAWQISHQISRYVYHEG